LRPPGEWHGARFLELPDCIWRGATAASISAVNSLGSLCGFAGPYMIWLASSATLRTAIRRQPASWAFVLVAGALTAIAVPIEMVNKQFPMQEAR